MEDSPPKRAYTAASRMGHTPTQNAITLPPVGAFGGGVSVGAFWGGGVLHFHAEVDIDLCRSVTPFLQLLLGI